MRALLLGLAGMVGGGILGALLGVVIVMAADGLGWIEHGADGLGGAAAVMLLSTLLALLLGLGGLLWGVIAGSRTPPADTL